MGKEIVLATSSRDYTDEQKQLFRAVIAPGATDEQVAMVYHIAKSMGLDPLRREVMLLPMRNDEGNQDYCVLVNVHGLIKMAGREADYGGLLSAVVYPGEACIQRSDGSVEHEYNPISRAKLRDDGTEDPNARRILPVGAWATVRRMLHGQMVNFTSFVLFSECCQWKYDWYTDPADKQRKKRKVLRSIWSQRPAWMIEKCAIAFAIRKSYDHVIGRAYGAEEFGLMSTESGAIELPPDFDANEGALLQNGGSSDAGRGTVHESEAGRSSGDIGEPSQELPPEEGAPPAGKVADGTASPTRPSRDEAPTQGAAPNSQAGAPPSAEEINAMLSETWEQVDDAPPFDPPVVTEQDIITAARKGADSFNPPRSFLAQHPDGWWLTDAEVLAKLKYAKPFPLKALDSAELGRIRAAINDIVYNKGGKRGRRG